MRRRLVMMSVGVGLALAAWLGVRAVEARRFRADLARAREAFGAQRAPATDCGRGTRRPGPWPASPHPPHADPRSPLTRASPGLVVTSPGPIRLADRPTPHRRLGAAPMT